MAASRRPIILAALLAAACSNATETENLDRADPAGALQLAIRYAETHFPKGEFQPGGAALNYHVGDAGAFWKIELQPVGHIGGGLVMMVRKRDMEVISAGRTQ